MATEILYPGEVAGRDYTPTVIGPPPQWADASDATYAEHTMVWKVPFDLANRRDQTQATFGTLTAAPGSVTQIAVHLRAKATTNDPNGCRVHAYLGDAVTNAQVIVPEDADPGQGWHITADDTIREFDLVLSPANYAGFSTDMLSVATALAAGVQVNMSMLTVSAPNGTWTGSLTVYEFWIVVTYAIRRRIAHNRGVQRGSDGQGVTGGKRGLQRTSRQSSLRGISFL